MILLKNGKRTNKNQRTIAKRTRISTEENQIERTVGLLANAGT